MNDKIGRLFIKFQSEGEKSLTKEQLKSVEPLIWSQKKIEITFQLYIESMCDSWSWGHGWLRPLEELIEYWENETDGKWMLERLLEVKEKIKNESMISFIKSSPLLTDKQKNRYFTRIAEGSLH